MKTEISFATKAIHVGQMPDPQTGAVVPPISLSSTFKQKSPGVHQGYEYARSANPTRKNLEEVLAALENGEVGLAFASGLAAESTLLDALPANSHIIASDDLYGGTYRLFERVKKVTSNLAITYVDCSNIESIKNAIKPNTAMFWAETPSNPLLKVIDLQGIADILKGKNIIKVCDNTFASPYLQQPLELGFDVVVHSATKYLGGHSDVIGGALILKTKNEFSDKVTFLQNSLGSVPGPFDCYLVHRGIKTLAVRMDRHCSNALEIAKFLETHPKVEKVIYPGLTSHPQNSICKKQMKSGGGMVSIILKEGLTAAKKLLENVQIFTLAESLGGVESLIEHPALMTHASIPKEVREKIGIDDGLVRLSVGIEDSIDLINDLKQGLK